MLLSKFLLKFAPFFEMMTEKGKRWFYFSSGFLDSLNERKHRLKNGK